MTIQKFKDNGYVHLKNVLDEQSCKNLTKYLKDLVNQQQTINDSQCPLSQAVHGAEEFDKLLQALVPYFEEKSGLKLYPTYSYARLYNQQGEELKNHRDRPACEISASITLGFEGDVWSIYMADKATEQDGILKIGEHNNKDYIKNISKIDMTIGDAVMYRGCDKYHWREPYTEGQWQAQVFLHYVDANGPHAEWKYDKRESLGISKTIQNEIQSFDECYKVDNAISEGFCKKLIEEYAKPEVEKLPPEIGNIAGNVNLNIRNVQRLQLPLFAGIGATLTAIGLQVNHQIWQYHITHSNQSEFLMYDINGKYETHVDTFHQRSNETRKLTVLAFLNDDFEGGKFYIQNSNQRFYPQQTPGTVLVFPSFMPHGVEPVTKGIRYSIVTWMVGEYFK
jgi:predicted 2-oxoglutarate/Fe(II)-dependent dioxygenase YbiX